MSPTRLTVIYSLGLKLDYYVMNFRSDLCLTCAADTQECQKGLKFIHADIAYGNRSRKRNERTIQKSFSKHTNIFALNEMRNNLTTFSVSIESPAQNRETRMFQI